MKKILLFTLTALACSVSCFAALDYKASGIQIEVQNEGRNPIRIARSKVTGSNLNLSENVKPADIHEKSLIE